MGELPIYLAQSPDQGFLGLGMVQFVGVAIGLWVTSKVPKLYGPEFPAQLHDTMMRVVRYLLGLTSIVVLIQGDFLSFVLATFTITFDTSIIANKLGLDLKLAVWIFFLADFAVLAFLIRATGGPQRSLFSAFLFVIVPITIALGADRVGFETVGTFTAITIGIFLGVLWWEPGKPASGMTGIPRSPPTPAEIREADIAKSRKIWSSVITTVCVLFPTTVSVLQQLGPTVQTTAITPLALPSGSNSSDAQRTSFREDTIWRDLDVGQVSLKGISGKPSGSSAV